MRPLTVATAIGLLLSGPAVAQTNSVLFNAGGGCVIALSSFAKKHKLELLRPRYIDPALSSAVEQNPDAEIINCGAAGPCTSPYLLVSKDGRSVEALILKYLASDKAVRDRKRTLSNAANCMTRRTVFEKSDR